MTIGGCGALMVPNSGIVTWKSLRDFQQIRLERLVGAVEFVDQQHRRAGDIRLQRLQQRPLDQKALGENVRRQLLAIGIAGGFRQPDRDHLRGAVPLIDRGGDVEAFIALQPDQLAPQRRRQHLCDFGLADAGLAFEKQRPAHAQRQIGHRRQRTLGEIAARGQQLEHRIDGFGQRRCTHGKTNLDTAGMRQRHGFGGRGFDGAARQHPDQMRAIFGAAVQIAVQPFRRHRHAVEHLVRETLLQASSNAVTRNTPSEPAPVTATRTSDGRLATNTPTSA